NLLHCQATLYKWYTMLLRGSLPVATHDQKRLSRYSASAVVHHCGRRAGLKKTGQDRKSRAGSVTRHDDIFDYNSNVQSAWRDRAFAREFVSLCSCRTERRVGSN